MKKIISTFLVLLMALSLVACSSSKETATTEEPVQEQVFRTIIVGDINGSVEVKHADTGEKFLAYEGMSLLNGDDITVGPNSDLTLDVDSDKHLFVEENTHFVLVAEGDEATAKTKIKIDKGSVLAQIENKLTDAQSFDIETATSTMSVRGTVFRVALFVTADNQIVDMVEVYNGKVWSNISNTDAEVTLEPGQCALIKEATAGEETVFLAPNQIDESFWNGTSSEIKILEGVEPSEDLVHEIAYNQLSSKMVESLQEVSTSGQELSITKEDLVVLEENIKKAEEKVEVVTPVYTPKKVVEEVVEEVYTPTPTPTSTPEPEPTPAPAPVPEPTPDPQPKGAGLSFIESSDILTLVKLFSNKWSFSDGNGGTNTIEFQNPSFKMVRDANYPNKYNIASLIIEITYSDGSSEELVVDGCDFESEVATRGVLDKQANGSIYQLSFPDSKNAGESYNLMITPAQTIVPISASIMFSKYIDNTQDYSHTCSINNEGKFYVTYYNSSEMFVYESTLVDSGATILDPTDQFKADHDEHELDTVTGYFKDGVQWTYGTDTVTEDTILTFDWVS